jgi:tetratricopeptide (TPR) repeat protein
MREQKKSAPITGDESKRTGNNWKIRATASIVVFFSLAIRSFAATATPSFEQANASFAAGNDHEAIAQYEALLAHNGYSAPVLFNLGNAFYRAGRFGAAILNYERALVLAPQDPNVAANLRLAREQAGVTAPLPNAIEQAARALSPNTIAWMGSAALAAFCLALGLRRFRPQFSPAKVIVGIAAGVLLTVAAMFALRWREFNQAIVTVAQAPARIAPASTAAETFALKAGEPVTAGKTYGQFILVRTPDGRSGWVSRQEIGLVFQAKPKDGRSI